MAGNNPRKFKDRIALIAQKEAESTQQFQDVMRSVSEVKKPKTFPSNFDGGGLVSLGGNEGMVIPRHLAPGLPNHHPHYRYGGSLPNVNQMATVGGGGGGSDVPQSGAALPGVPQVQHSGHSVPLDQPGFGQYTEGGQHRGSERSLGGAGSGASGGGGGGGGAIRNRSGERRWESSSPYSDRNYYSSSLVTTYLSPPPETRWRRTSSDSALYQKLTQPASPNQKSPSEQGSPEYSPAGEDVKPAPELLETLLREGEQQLQTVKEEPSQQQSAQYHHQSSRVSSQHSGSSSPVSPHYTQPTFLPPHHQHQHNLEKEFRRFRLDVDCPPQFQDSGGPTSPHTPSALPDIYIQDWSQDCDKSLDADFVNTMREGLEPIDDQLLATLTSTATFVDPAVEEQFKMNY